MSFLYVVTLAGVALVVLALLAEAMWRVSRPADWSLEQRPLMRAAMAAAPAAPAARPLGDRLAGPRRPHAEPTSGSTPATVRSKPTHESVDEHVAA